MATGSHIEFHNEDSYRSTKQTCQSENTTVLLEQESEESQLLDVSSSGPTSLVPATPVTPTTSISNKNMVCSVHLPDKVK